MSEHTINTGGREASFATIAGEQNVQRIAIERMQKQLSDLDTKIDKLRDAIHIGNGQPAITSRLARVEQHIEDCREVDNGSAVMNKAFLAMVSVVGVLGGVIGSLANKLL